MIAKMERVEIVFLRSLLPDIIAFLQEQGVLHVESVPLALENHPGYLHRVHLPEAEKKEQAALQELQGFLKETVPLLNPTPAHAAVVAAGQRLEQTGFDGAAKPVRGWHRNLRSLHRRKLNVQDNLDVLANYERILNHIAPALRERKLVFGETARAFVLQGLGAEGIDELERRFIESVGPEAEFIRNAMGRSDLAVVLTFPASKKGAVDELIKTEGIVPADVSDKDIAATGVDESLSKVAAKMLSLKEDLAEITQEIQGYSQQNGADIEAVDQVVKDRLARLSVVEGLAQSDMVGVVHGWVPSDSHAALCSTLKTKFGDKVALGKLDPHEIEHKRIPTLLKNPAILKPFELILKLFQPPTYGHLDPTGMVAVSFILFYGFIMGDAGYGLVIGAVAWWARSKWKHVPFVRDAMTIALWMAASAIVWGIIYAEFFGDIPTRLGIPAIFHRAHETTVLLGISILFGVVHIVLSLVLGVRENYRHGHIKHAQERLGMLLGLLALGCALAASADYLPARAGAFLAVAFFLGALTFFVIGMGMMSPMGVLEILSISSNILSYSRLMALGVASFALADIANALPDMLGFVMGTLLALFVHCLNIGIGVFSPTIHSLRLNYVEFLPKFYEPEGREYEPFRKGVVW